MGQDMISSLLDKLSKKTGREWSLADIIRLAQKLPELNGQNLDSVLGELYEMGLDVPDGAKEKIMTKLSDGSVDHLQSKIHQDLTRQTIPQPVKKKPKKRPGAKRKSKNQPYLNPAAARAMSKKSKTESKKKR
ncbi:hypothetical protein [Brevibacillus dissolubilis]|uniref:hypothetical protein n=1 Tax=Brevibacillus dissolubilis TaxID=1844116 RepID=UPI0011169C1D|nr:hypothetical protein [Brevibacillus dissolubilis]